jgi:hypothetical protein
VGVLLLVNLHSVVVPALAVHTSEFVGAAQMIAHLEAVRCQHSRVGSTRGGLLILLATVVTAMRVTVATGCVRVTVRLAGEMENHRADGVQRQATERNANEHVRLGVGHLVTGAGAGGFRTFRAYTAERNKHNETRNQRQKSHSKKKKNGVNRPFVCT